MFRHKELKCSHGYTDKKSYVPMENIYVPMVLQRDKSEFDVLSTK